MARVLLANVVVVLIALCVSSSHAIENFGPCMTARNNVGLCIHLQNCQYMYEKMRNYAKLNATEKAYLKDSQCGYDNREHAMDRRVLICCADKFATVSNEQEIDPGNLIPEPGKCGVTLVDRIVGGNVTAIGEYPWMALIQIEKGTNDFGFLCGGSLITSRYVLTAAHCVINPKFPDFKVHSVRLGEWNLATSPDCITLDLSNKTECAEPHKDVRVEMPIVHFLYEPGSQDHLHDVALLRLVESVAYTKYIRPICLPIADELRDSLFPKREMHVAGWGLTENHEPSPVQLKVMTRIWDIENCTKKYLRRTAINSTLQLCAGGEVGVDACDGDSGGPLMAREHILNRSVHFIAGVVSYGPKPCGLSNWPGVYARVGYYLNWIKENLKP